MFFSSKFKEKKRSHLVMEKIIKWPAIFFKSIECLTFNFDIVLVNYLGTSPEIRDI